MSAPAAVRRTAQILNASGLHARPATQLAELARRYTATLELVVVEPGPGSGAAAGDQASAKEVLDLILLALAKGSTVTVQGHGPDAAAGVAAVGELIDRRFGEV